MYTSTDSLLKGVAPLQLQDPLSSTFTYLLADSNTKNAVIIDPVIEQVRTRFRVESWRGFLGFGLQVDTTLVCV